MNEWIAIYLAGRGLEDSRLNPFCKAQHVDGAHYARFNRLYWIVLIMNGRCRAGQTVDLVDLEHYWLRNIVADQFKILIVAKMSDVLLSAGKKVVKAHYLISIIQKPFAKMRTDEPGTARNKDSHNIYRRGTETRWKEKRYCFRPAGEELPSESQCLCASGVNCYFRCFSKKAKMRSYSSVQLSGRTKPWFSEG
jgi:hypothetical protein